MDFILRVISVVCVVYCLYVYTRLMIDIISGFVELKKVKASPYQGIKCENISFKLKNYIINIFFDVLFIYCFIQLCDSSEKLGIEWSMWIYRFLVIVQILSALAHIIVAFYDEYAYLTPQGMVHITGVMKPAKSRYTWEESEDGLSSNLLVYRAKSEVPLRFKVLDRLEVAHEMVKGYKL